MALRMAIVRTRRRPAAILRSHEGTRGRGRILRQAAAIRLRRVPMPRRAAAPAEAVPTAVAEVPTVPALTAAGTNLLSTRAPVPAIAGGRFRVLILFVPPSNTTLSMCEC